ncbi:hypothetical protein [Streptomyces sp. NPDC088789]|uniref:hypothetical protein n=1 Tax=Streptomyces sp. NPDC088789 TaxID=3365899 RepID=UPI00381F0C74
MAEKPLTCGHAANWRGPEKCQKTGDEICANCYDAQHYARVREQYAELEAKGTAEGWTYEYLNTPYDVWVRSRELVGKLVCRAYWRRQDTPAWGIVQPAHMYRSAFKRLKAVVPNSPVTGFALVFEDGSRDPLCYDMVCVITGEPAEQPA